MGQSARVHAESVKALPPGTAARWLALRSRLTDIVQQYPDAAFATSMGAEDAVLTHAIATGDLPIAMFTLDTGRLHAQTVAMIDAVQQRYGRALQVYRPDAEQVFAHVSAHGAYAFYESVALRKACCHIRKVEPLRRALAGRSAWLTGQRRDQAVTRGTLPEHEHDGVFGLYKFNPLAQWSDDDVWAVIRHFDILYNPLHDEGYPSIGCDPCTRPIREGEDVRAGRWWWESADAKECGLHAGNTPAIAIRRIDR